MPAKSLSWSSRNPGCIAETAFVRWSALITENKTKIKENSNATSYVFSLQSSKYRLIQLATALYSGLEKRQNKNCRTTFLLQSAVLKPDSWMSYKTNREPITAVQPF